MEHAFFRNVHNVGYIFISSIFSPKLENVYTAFSRLDLLRWSADLVSVNVLLNRLTKYLFISHSFTSRNIFPGISRTKPFLLQYHGIVLLCILYLINFMRHVPMKIVLCSYGEISIIFYEDSNVFLRLVNLDLNFRY